MKALIQRVHSANVVVDKQEIAQIDRGILAYIGIGRDDDVAKAKKLVDKILSYRIFENTTKPDKLGKLDHALSDVGGGLLLVSQFTLMANTNSGRRPDFSPAMSPVLAADLFAQLVAYAKQIYAPVQVGQFGANMQVSAVNDGPINFLLEV